MSLDSQLLSRANTRHQKRDSNHGGYPERRRGPALLNPSRVLLLVSAIQLIAMKLTWAAPCPAETPLYGGAILDGSADEYMTYFAVNDDDLTIIKGMEVCT